MNQPALAQQLKSIPSTPGIYIYKDAKGNVLYVGKAKVLKNRVKSYFQKRANLDPAKQAMVKKIASLQTISTDTENEALVLEANLIRKYQPPYNVVLRDDKYYLFIKITKEDIPRIFPVRRILKDGARYFGPYSSATSVRGTLRLLRRIFPFKGEKDAPHDRIFPHPLFARSANNAPHSSIKSSDVGHSSNPATYESNITNIIRFLKGDRDTIMRTLIHGMKKASSQEKFEQATLFRNQFQAIERLEGSQKVYLASEESFDAISIMSESTQSAVNIFQVRKGKLLGKQTFLLKHQSQSIPQDILRQFLLQYYQVAQNIPEHILLPLSLTDKEEIASFIRPANPPTISVPKRGKKHQLITMGETNATQLLTEQQIAFQTNEKQKKAHSALVTAINLNPEQVHRIETYDISNIQGTLATASMVVFYDGEPKTSQYRKFKIKNDGTPNDFAMLQETLRRRFAKRNEDWPMPDLIIIDGGKGQLSSTVKILNELHINVPIISLAKREEEIFIPGYSESTRLPYDSPALYLIQRMRDEAHRFTITYHRLLRSKQQHKSILDSIPSIGPKTKKLLLANFGSVANLRKASEKEISTIIGEQKTKILLQHL